MKINLIPDIIQNRRREAKVKKMATMGLVGWLALLAVITLGTLGYLGIQNVAHSRAQKQHDELNAKVNSPENQKFRKEALEVQASLSALKDLFNHQRKLSVAMKSVADLTPKSVRLKDINLTADSRIVIAGRAGSYEEAGKMVVAMKESESKAKDDQAFFTNVALGGANQGDVGVDFTVSADYVDPKAVVAAATGAVQ